MPAATVRPALDPSPAASHSDRSSGRELGADWALLLDVDGTLLDLAPRPELVVVPASLRDALGSLAERLGGRLALISGRPIASIDALFAPLVLPAAGEHGAELRRHGAAPGEPQPAVEATVEIGTQLAALDPALAALAAAHDGVWVERKRAGRALHYRAAPEAESALVTALRNLLAEHVQLELLAGKRVLEIRACGVDKGGAVRALMAAPPFAGHRPLYLGDDVTDAAAIAAARALDGRGLWVGRGPAGEAGAFTTPAAVRDWLTSLTAALTETPCAT